MKFALLLTHGLTPGFFIEKNRQNDRCFGNQFSLITRRAQAFPYGLNHSIGAINSAFCLGSYRDPGAIEGTIANGSKQKGLEN